MGKEFVNKSAKPKRIDNLIKIELIMWRKSEMISENSEQRAKLMKKCRYYNSGYCKHSDSYIYYHSETVCNSYILEGKWEKPYFIIRHFANSGWVTALDVWGMRHAHTYIKIIIHSPIIIKYKHDFLRAQDAVFLSRHLRVNVKKSTAYPQIKLWIGRQMLQNYITTNLLWFWFLMWI